MAIKRQKITLSVSSKAREGLAQLAQQFGFMRNGSGNISKLLEYIGLGQLEITGASYENAVRIEAEHTITLLLEILEEHQTTIKQLKVKEKKSVGR